MKVIAEILIAVFGFLTSWIGRGNRIESRLSDIDKRVLRLEILQAMYRKDTRTVCALFDDYKALGGNSYMVELYNEYMKQQKRKKKC